MNKVYPIDPTTKEEILPEVTQPSYLGLNFCRTRTREGLQLFWRIEEKRIRKWHKLHQKVEQTMSFRTVAKICGAALWAAHIHLIPLCRSAIVVDMVKRCGTACRRRADWDRTIEWTDEDVELMKASINVACGRQWVTAPRQPSNEIILATDSSSKRWGRIMWNGSKTMLEDRGGDWNAKMLPASIFVKELTAAVIAIEKVSNSVDLHNSTIRIFVDNSAAAAVLRRLASSTDAGMELAMRCDRALARSSCELEVHLITTDQNPADDPSRNRIASHTRICRLWEAYETARLGSRIDMPVRSAEHQRIRHAEQDTDISAYDDESDIDTTDEWSFVDSMFIDDESPVA